MMDIERILKIEQSDEDALGMVLSNHIELMHKDKAYIRCCNDQLTADLMKWKNRRKSTA